MKIVKLEQRSAAWHQWRAKGLGGSEIPVLVAYAEMLLADAERRGHPIAERSVEIMSAFEKLGLTGVYDSTPRKIWLSKKGLLKDDGKANNPDILRGIKHEDAIRELAEKNLGQKAISMCAEHDSVPHFRVSFDGILGDGRPLEVKAPSWRVFQKIKNDGIPPYYYPQVLYQNFIAGKDEGVFIAGLIDESRGVITDHHMEVIPSSQAFLSAMLRVADFFWETYVEGDEAPPLVAQLDVDTRDDETWAALAAEYKEAMEAVAFAKEVLDAMTGEADAIKQKLVNELGIFSKAVGSGIAVTKYYRAGTVNYKNALYSLAPKTAASDLEKFRGKGREEVKITVGAAAGQPADNSSGDEAPLKEAA